MKTAVLKLLILLAPAVVFASGVEHGLDHHAIEVPMTVLYQAINVTILVLVLIYFTKQGIINYFASRKSEYLMAAQKAAFAREQAEKEFAYLQDKIANLEQTRNDQLAKAKAHAEDLKNQMVVEADQVTARIRSEAALTAQLEIQKAMKDLQRQLLSESVQAAHSVLSRDIASGDHLKLQSEFIKDIEVVR